MTQFREANSALKQEPKAAHYEAQVKHQKVEDPEANLSEAAKCAPQWHLKAKELETQLQQSDANEDWARSIVRKVKVVNPPSPRYVACPQNHETHLPTLPLQPCAKGLPSARCTC